MADGCFINAMFAPASTQIISMSELQLITGLTCLVVADGRIHGDGEKNACKGTDTSRAAIALLLTEVVHAGFAIVSTCATGAHQ